MRFSATGAGFTAVSPELPHLRDTPIEKTECAIIRLTAGRGLSARMELAHSDKSDMEGGNATPRITCRDNESLLCGLPERLVVVLAGAFRRSVHLAQFPEDILVQSRALVVVPQRLGVVALCRDGLLGKLPRPPCTAPSAGTLSGSVSRSCRICSPQRGSPRCNPPWKKQKKYPLLIKSV